MGKSDSYFGTHAGYGVTYGDFTGRKRKRPRGAAKRAGYRSLEMPSTMGLALFGAEPGVPIRRSLTKTERRGVKRMKLKPRFLSAISGRTKPHRRRLGR